VIGYWGYPTASPASWVRAWNMMTISGMMGMFGMGIVNGCMSGWDDGEI
jgi:hypothetical protein